jgi:signal transduction histidine kinase
MASSALAQERVYLMPTRRPKREKDENLLAGRVAHDLRNILQIISGNLTLLASKIGDDEAVRRHIDRAMAGVDLGTRLTGTMLGTREGGPAGPATCIGSTRDTIEAILKEVSGDGINVIVTTPSAPCAVAVDKADLENVLINLALNARDAMERAGTLCVTFENDLDAGRPSVVVTVTDSGCGMLPGVAARIFDPYFTTKGANGSGLGLATVRRFANECGGAVSVDSTPGKGTSFCVRMPAASM